MKTMTTRVRRTAKALRSIDTNSTGFLLWTAGILAATLLVLTVVFPVPRMADQPAAGQKAITTEITPAPAPSPEPKNDGRIPTPSKGAAAGAADTGENTGKDGQVVPQGEDPGQGASAAAVRQAYDFFEDYRLERDRARSQRTEILTEMIEDQNSDPEVRKRAQDELLKATGRIELELKAEYLIKAKDISDAVVMLSDGQADVVVKAEELSQAQAAQIGDIVTRVCGVPVQKVTILTVKR